ncbi:MAG: hypothetical protein H0S80_07240 [Desulfovibrionaceae bacterium]|nr:hypothetical protein [Desulfovibrionaceae bacterium]
MIDYRVQSDYLRQVQRTFEGGGNLDVLGHLYQVLLVAAPVLAVMVLWRYRHLIAFGVGHAVSSVFARRNHRVIENYLVSKGVLLEVCLYTPDGVGMKICDARVESVVRGRMNLQLVNVVAATLKFKNFRVICFAKPFAYSGRRINAFISYIGRMDRKGVVLKHLSLMTPIRYQYIIRRRYARRRVAREGAVRVKAWAGRRVNSFWMAKPDMQTVNNPADYGKNTRLVVDNISAGGLRLYVRHPKPGLPPMQKGNQLVLRVSIWNPKRKKFAYFTALGIVRSRFSGASNSIGLGIQFVAEGEKAGSGYTWHPVRGGIKTLAKFLAQLEE